MARKNTSSLSLSQRATVSPNQVQPSLPLLATVLLSHAHPSLLRRRARLLAAQDSTARRFEPSGREGKGRARPRRSCPAVVAGLVANSPSCRCVGGHRRRLVVRNLRPSISALSPLRTQPTFAFVSLTAPGKPRSPPSFRSGFAQLRAQGVFAFVRCSPQ